MSKPKAKRGRPASSPGPSRGSARLARIVDRDGIEPTLEAIGCSRATLWAWRAGKAMPGPSWMPKLADLGIQPIAWFQPTGMQ